MDWIDYAQKLWWLLGVLIVILLAVWRLAIKVNKSKEQLKQVEDNKKAIDVLKNDIVGIKENIEELKENVDQQAKTTASSFERQAKDTTAILSLLQSITIALHDKDCDIGTALNKFNEHLAKR